MTKQQFLTRLRRTRRQWDRLVATAAARQAQPADSAGWSLADIVAHITWYEREMVGLVHAHALVGSDMWNWPLDKRNAAIAAANKGRTLQDVLAETHQIHHELMAALTTLDDADFVDAGRFAQMPADWIPWQVMAGNTWEHYQEHTEQVEQLQSSLTSPSGP